MATLAEVDDLTRQHVADQLKIARGSQLEAVTLWKLLRLESLDAATADWLAAQTKIVLRGRTLSAIRAAEYYNAMRVRELGAPIEAAAGLTKAGQVLVPLDAVRPSEAVLEQARTSSRVTGPIRVWKNLALGRSPEVAMRAGAAGVTGSTQRLVLEGGRVAQRALMGIERRTVFYERVTSGGDSCEFCQMLASRGPVYTAASGDFEAHDSCGCSIRPRFAGRRGRRRGSTRRGGGLVEYSDMTPVAGI